MSYSVACYWEVGYCVGDLPCGATGGAGTGHGHGGTKKRYVIAGRDLTLTDAQLRDALSAILFRPLPKPSRKARKALRGRVGRGVPAVAPQASQRASGPSAVEIVTYPAAPRFDKLWGERWVRRQAEVMRVLRELAYEADLQAQDEEDVTMLLGAT